jgi:hypothetical protein
MLVTHTITLIAAFVPMLALFVKLPELATIIHGSPPKPSFSNISLK